MEKVLRDSLLQSLAIHFGIASVIFFVVWWDPASNLHETFKIQVKEVEIPFPTEMTPPQINLAPPEIEAESQAPKPVKKVFGITRDTLTSSSSSAVAVKLGTTLAKERDSEIIDESEAISLPTPTAEYLVTEMPKLKSEIRVPYPPEAKKNNVEGLVVMDLLIDEKGKVRLASLIEGPGFGLNEAALAAMKGFEFEPAKVDGRSVAVKIRYSYRFVLE